MEFKEEIEKVIEEGLAKLESKRKPHTEFRDGWDETREIILVAFNEARDVTKARIGETEAGHRDDCTRLAIKAPMDEDDWRMNFELEFCPNFHSFKVTCKSSDDLPAFKQEDFILESLTREKVNEKTVAFIRAIFDTLADPPAPVL